MIRERLDLASPVVYVLLTFAISWSFYASWVLVPGLDTGTATLLLLGGGLGPVIAALVLVRLRHDIALGQWLRERFRLRVSPWLYVFSLALPPLGI